MFHRHLPVPIVIQDSIKQWTFGLYPACIKYLMSAFDLPEVRTISRGTQKKKSMTTETYCDCDKNFYTLICVYTHVKEH